ncbi:TetR/AcrR family transcriptional regulator [Mangrovibacter phragmitis]
MPRQARATVTMDAIFEATIQLLVADGIHRLTTTRVAERAGVSVGTMYQYFPHKESLVYALNERYLAALADRIEITCRNHRGAKVGAMIEALITTHRKRAPAAHHHVQRLSGYLQDPLKYPSAEMAPDPVSRAPMRAAFILHSGHTENQ